MKRKGLKAGLLVIALVIPALVFLFLDFFGENRFDIRTYFPEEVNGEDTTYYHMPPEISKQQIHVACFVDDPDTRLRNQISRLHNEWPDASARLVFYTPGNASGGLCRKASYCQIAELPADSIQSLACETYRLCDQFGRDTGLFNKYLVLVDEKGRIRGYYKALEAEEIDRLHVELDILLENAKASQ